jgi:hypothetical protein
LLSLVTAGIFGVAAFPLERDVLLGLAVTQLGAAVVLRVMRSRRAARREQATTKAAGLAAFVGLRDGRALAQSLQVDQLPAPLTVWGLVMAPGESPYLDVEVHYSRFYGRDVAYRRSSAYLLGGGPGMTFAAGCLMLGDSVEQSRAVRSAQPRWRAGQHTRAVLTDRRLLVLADNEWVELAYSQVKAFYPDPWSWRVVLEFAGSCAPLCLTGPDTPSVMAYLCWALHGASGLRTHPSLQPLR